MKTFVCLLLLLLPLQQRLDTQWVKCAGLPDCAALAVTADPRHAGTAYAGTEAGVFVSTDDGVTWAPAERGAKLANVRAFAMKEIGRAHV